MLARFIKGIYAERMEELRDAEKNMMRLAKDDPQWKGNLHVIRKTMREYDKWVTMPVVNFMKTRITDIGEENTIKEENVKFKAKKILH